MTIKKIEVIPLGMQIDEKALKKYALETYVIQ
jgi:hypothetical protein